MAFFNSKKEEDPNKEQSLDEVLDSSADPAQQLSIVREILENTQAQIKKALDLIRESNIDNAQLLDSLENARKASRGLRADDHELHSGGERIIEGVFNGEKMVGGDGNEYNIPPNYASKSKLVEGDILKLTIRGDGSFIYKQIGPVERRQMVADLMKNTELGEWYALKDNKRWKLLTASVTYFHGEAGDEVVILIPKEGASNWAAVENIIKVPR